MPVNTFYIKTTYIYILVLIANSFVTNPLREHRNME